MDMRARDKAHALLRDAYAELKRAELRIEQDMPLRAAERIHDAEKKLMDARHLLAAAHLGAVEP